MKLSLLFSTLTILALLTAQISGKKCHALILQGGGDLGAYQAGGIAGLIENLAAEDVTYDIVTGVSVGAVNGMAASIYAPGQEVEMKEFIMENWRSLRAENVYKGWFGGITQGVLFESGIYNNAPLREFLAEKIGDQTIKR
jgi:predicted acylesterase/phospholipase RssA